ncbi:Transposable element Tc3 transposase [Thelohanellus kitauei]|uniref:Transposable element Tc3 transposase n=1 Tax=Thelohanellus kitauei TaxID=669202 RepID=A0A0C2NEU5_THEKT|nr:Transposable element Tc3 transposase [Thelohanellus kitauei]
MKLKNPNQKYGGGSIMIWEGVSRYLKTPIIKSNSTIDSNEYQRMLQNMIGDWPENIIFQQDNASPHVSKSTIQFLKNKQIKQLEWPSCIPDLNIIENEWSKLSSIVYIRRKYENVEEM